MSEQQEGRTDSNNEPSADSLAKVADKRAQRYGKLAEIVDQKIGKIAALRFVAFIVMSASFFSAWYDQASFYVWVGLGAGLTFAITVWLHRTLYSLLP